MRLFVAIELVDEARDFALQSLELLKASISRQGVRLVKPEKVHLTLAFLGDIEDSSLDSLKSALDGVNIQPEVALSLGSLGGFPDLHRPKVIWLGLTDGVDSLSRLAERIVAASKPFAPQLDEKGFSPHITLARVSPGSKEVGRIVSKLPRSEEGARMEVAAFALIHSRRDGTYEKLHEFGRTVGER